MAPSWWLVNPFQRSIRIGCGITSCTPHRLDDIVNIGEVALHLAVVVDVNTFTFQHRFRELEQRHIRAAPRAIDGKEAQSGGWDAVKMR
jgi:hypothetical protein